MKKTKNWKKAVEKFVDEWKNKKGVEIIYVSGSHVTGYAGEHSDIDVEIIVNNTKNKKQPHKKNSI